MTAHTDGAPGALISIPFHGHTLVTFQRDGEHYAVMKPIAEGMGLDWSAQLRRIQRHPILSTSIAMMATQMPGDDQNREMLALPLRLLNGWLFGIEVDRVKAHLRETILTYQRECYDALYRYWHEGAALNPRADITARYPQTGSPFDNVQASKLGKLQRTNKSAAYAYLIDCGVTPDYVQSVLQRHGAVPPLAVATLGGPAAAPLDHLAHEVPLQFDREDGHYWYLLRETFARICGDYDVTATARGLNARGLLRHDSGTLTKKLQARAWGYGGGRVFFFAISKRLAQGGAR